jgi:hypothetical protein
MENDTVRMIGPKGKISYVSKKASQSKHLRQIGFVPEGNVIPEKPEDKGEPVTKSKKANA